MEREQIIKALECCAVGTTDECKKCPRHHIRTLTDEECMEGLIRATLILIDGLTEDNERLNGKVAEYEEERKYHFEMSRKRIAEAEADTVRKVLARIKKYFESYTGMIHSASVHYYITEKEKEFLEEKE